MNNSDKIRLPYHFSEFLPWNLLPALTRSGRNYGMQTKQTGRRQDHRPIDEQARIFKIFDAPRSLI
jgi:hypothetical protein